MTNNAFVEDYCNVDSVFLYRIPVFWLISSEELFPLRIGSWTTSSVCPVWVENAISPRTSSPSLSKPRPWARRTKQGSERNKNNKKNPKIVLHGDRSVACNTNKLPLAIETVIGLFNSIDLLRSTCYYTSRPIYEQICGTLKIPGCLHFMNRWISWFSIFSELVHIDSEFTAQRSRNYRNQQTSTYLHEMDWNCLVFTV